MESKKDRPLNNNHKKFAKNYIKAHGNKIAAYHMTYPNATRVTAEQNTKYLMKDERIKEEIQFLLDKQGLSREFFMKKLGDLAEAKDKEGNPDNRVQLEVVKMGIEFHKLAPKQQQSNAPTFNVNYNLDAEKLGGVLSKLSEVTKKLQLSSFNNGQVENAEIIEADSGCEVVEENTGSEECGCGVDGERRLETPSDTETA